MKKQAFTKMFLLGFQRDIHELDCTHRIRKEKSRL